MAALADINAPKNPAQRNAGRAAAKGSLDTPLSGRQRILPKFSPDPDAFGHATEGFARFMGTPVSGFHDARATPGNDRETQTGNCRPDLGSHLVIGRPRLGARRTENGDRWAYEMKGPESPQEIRTHPEDGPQIVKTGAGTREEAPVRCFQLEPVFLADRFFVDRVFGVRLGKIGAFGRRHRPLSNTIFRLPPR